jgi:hypothetical protein
MKKPAKKSSHRPVRHQPAEVQANQLRAVRGGSFLTWLWGIIDGTPPKYECDSDTAVA